MAGDFSNSSSPKAPSARREKDERTSLLVRNLARSCMPEELRAPFERFGPLKDVYLPRDFYTREPRGFGFVQYYNAEDAQAAREELNRTVLLGREMIVAFAEEDRRKPEEMRYKEKLSRRVRHNEPRYERRFRRSPSPSDSRRAYSPRRRCHSPSPPLRRRSYYERSLSPARRRSISPDERDVAFSPSRRHENHYAGKSERDSN